MIVVCFDIHTPAPSNLEGELFFFVGWGVFLLWSWFLSWAFVVELVFIRGVFSFLELIFLLGVFVDNVNLCTFAADLSFAFDKMQPKLSFTIDKTGKKLSFVIDNVG